MSHKLIQEVKLCKCRLDEINSIINAMDTLLNIHRDLNIELIDGVIQKVEKEKCNEVVKDNTIIQM